MSPIAAGPAGTTISLVVNTCNRRDELRTLLYALNRQTYSDFEVVVVIGPTTDGTAEMIAEEFPERVKSVPCPEFNLSVSRNIGLEASAGEVVAFIDDDSVPSTTWLAQLAAGYRDDGVAGVGGRTYLVREGADRLQFLRGLFSVIAEQQDICWDGTLPATRTPARFWFPRFHGTNMSYRWSALAAIGGFDERFEYLYDDGDIGVRLGLAGFRLRQLDHAVVYHLGSSTGNRGKHPYDLNWYSWSRSQIYFALKNGRHTVGLAAAVLAAIRHAANLSAQVRDLAERGELPEELHRKASGMLRQARKDGFRQGLFARRRIPGRITRGSETFLPFARELWRRSPAVAPAVLPSTSRIRPLKDEPLALALLSVDYPPVHTHGVARSTATLARGLAELGHEVHVVTSGDHHRVHVEHGAWIHSTGPVTIRRYPRFVGAGYSNLAAWINHSHEAYATLRTLRRDHGVQLVDSPLWNLDGYVASVAGDIPVAVRLVTAMRQIAEVHGDVDPEKRLLGDLEADFLRRAALLVSNSTATVNALREVYGIDPATKLHGLASYGMVPAEDERVPPPSSSRDVVKALFVGRLEGRKGVPELFAALPRALRASPGLEFVLAGSDNSRNDGFFAREGVDYPTWFSRHHPDLAGRVRFAGHVSDEELESLYAACDLFVAPSRYESFGLIFLEAMNFAKPVIGCDAGGPRDIIVEGETGRLVPPSDPDALAEALVELGGSADTRARMGRAGRARLLSSFTHLAMAERFVDLYRRALGRS